MTFIKNIRIGAKLTLGFTIVLLFVLGLAVYGIVTMNSVGDNYQRILDFPNTRFIIVEEIDMAVTDIRHYTAVAALHAGDLEAIARFEGYINENHELLEELANDFRQNMDDDAAMSQTARNERSAELNTLLDEINSYVNNYVTPIIAAARANDLSLAVELIYESLYFNEEVDDAFYDLFDDILAYLEQAREDNVAFRQNTIQTMIIVSVAALAIGIIIAVAITKIITKPVTSMVEVIEDVSQGKLNVNIQVTNKDEIGMLAKSVQALIGTLQRLISDMDKMASDHDRGEIDTFIDARSFDGEYGTVASKINDMMKAALETQNKVVGTFMQIASGDFNANMEQLPGKKAQLNEAVNDMRNQIEAVSGEINLLIDAAAVKGDLSIAIDADKYKGGWRDIMTGLNDIAKAVDAPLKVIGIVMGEMQAGNFDMDALQKKIVGMGYNADVSAYKGTFKDILSASGDSFGAISSYIIEISDTISAIAGGDLSVSISREYIGNFSAIKDSINNISTLLHKSMSEISLASKYVLEGATKITTSSVELSDGSTSQAASLEELHANVELVNQQTKKFADNAAEANTLSNKSTSNAQEGNSAMKQMLGAMMQIKDSSNNISKIIKVIQDIAFQTNLLALNAAVEAARAGEHGKGFAVVAEEVRSLAARSQDAASETTNLINDSITRVESGTSIAEATSVSLETIVSSANEVMSLINNITSAAADQAQMIAQISDTLLTTATTVQNNSRFAHESAATAEELNSQAEMLQSLVNYFKL